MGRFLMLLPDIIPFGRVTSDVVSGMVATPFIGLVTYPAEHISLVWGLFNASGEVKVQFLIAIYSYVRNPMNSAAR